MLLRTPIFVIVISSFMIIASFFAITMLLKTMIPFFDPIGITESKWVSEGNGMKLDDPIAASYAFLAIGKPYWNIETMLFGSFNGVRQTSPKLKMFV